MKKVIYTSRVRERKLEEAGYEFESYEYDYDAQKRAENLEKKGYDTKLLREQTDTPGLKMYSVWIKEK